MLGRREFLGAAGAMAAAGLSGCVSLPKPPAAVRVNDIHSRLNETWVERVEPIQSLDAARGALLRAARAKKSIAIAGGRHSMGGQQFATDAVLLDTRALNRVLGFDRERGVVEVEAGIQWPELVHRLSSLQAAEVAPWAITQKQTGADRLSIGGAMSSNIHSRGLKMKPFVSDIESVRVLDANGHELLCSRDENWELFGLLAGGYGLFGFVYSLKLRLTRRQKVERVAELINVDEFVRQCDQRIADGFTYGDLQYSTDAASDDFLQRGVFSCYRPVAMETPIPGGQKHLSAMDWKKLAYLAHTDKARAFKVYADYYTSTSGQIYWSDTHQLSEYVDDYHGSLDHWLGARAPSTEMITELYVPRASLAEFMVEAAEDLRRNKTEVIYGTIRLIERDDESFLAWAKEPWACVIFNLHVEHTPDGLVRGADAFRRLIDLAIRRRGSYYLTYHRWATKQQVLACYPQFPEFLRKKLEIDPEERFQSDWYRHYTAMFGEG